MDPDLSEVASTSASGPDPAVRPAVRPTVGPAVTAPIRNKVVPRRR